MEAADGCHCKREASVLDFLAKRFECELHARGQIGATGPFIGPVGCVNPNGMPNEDSVRSRVNRPSSIRRESQLVTSFLYSALRKLIVLVTLRPRSAEYKELEIVVLRHELAILRRRVTRPALKPVDRLLGPRGRPDGTRGDLPHLDRRRPHLCRPQPRRQGRHRPRLGGRGRDGPRWSRGGPTSGSACSTVCRRGRCGAGSDCSRGRSGFATPCSSSPDRTLRW